MNFGDKLRQLLDEHNLSQKQLAEQLNISASALGNYVRNTREPDFETVKKFAAYFDVSLDFLLDFQQCKKETPYDEQLLHIFHSMTEEQQEIFIEQGLVFIKHNNKKKA